MRIVDVNLLLYAIDPGCPCHERARKWWEGALSGDEFVGLPWVVVLGFVRLSTNPRVFPRPLDPPVALSLVREWLSRPMVRVPGPGEEHFRLLTELLEGAGTAGNLTTDAHLAALAIEHGAVLVSGDNDFARFPHLRWSNPLRD